MDLSICDDEKINIYIPFTLSEEAKGLHDDLLSYGYDLFNPNDSFYQDICTPIHLLMVQMLYYLIEEAIYLMIQIHLAKKGANIPNILKRQIN